MYIRNLQLINFRNYEELSVEFENKVNVIIGENAQGKTNLMESIYVLAMAKSYRTNKDKELIRWEQDYAKIKGWIEKKEFGFPLEITITKKGKKAKCNHIEQSRLSQYIGHLNVVIFAPEDLNLVKGSPHIRRRFLDMEIGQVSPVYLHDLSQYNKILQQRNHYLKSLQQSKTDDHTLLNIYTEQLIHLAARILEKRFEFVRQLEIWAKEIHASITSGREELKLRYKNSLNLSAEDSFTTMVQILQEQYEKVQMREIERGMTLFGPHRDDLEFFVNGKDVQRFGSQGQQRTTALSVKLAEIDMIKTEVGDYPILLLDDVLSELDDERQSHLLNSIQGKVQTFVTTTSVQGIDHETIREANMFHIHKGRLVNH